MNASAPAQPLPTSDEWHDEKRDEWTPLVEAAHPLRTKAYKHYDTAMKMVGNRRSKGALVELVCWLLQKADAAHPTTAPAGLPPVPTSDCAVNQYSSRMCERGVKGCDAAHPTTAPAGLREHLKDLIAKYWNLAYAEGKEGRTHDTEYGDAMRVLSEINACISALSAPVVVQTDVLEALKAARHFIYEESFPLGWNIDRIDAALDGLMADKMRYRKALLFACGGDEQKLRALLEAADAPTVNAEGTPASNGSNQHDPSCAVQGQVEPVAWMWQHDETGAVGFIDTWQVEKGWEKRYPRLKLVTPLFTHPTPVQAVQVGMTDERIAEACEAWNHAIVTGKGQSGAAASVRAILAEGAQK